MKIGQVFKEIRQYEVITLRQMEERTGILHKDLFDIESGSRNPEKEESEKISKVLNVPLAFVLYLSIEESDIQPGKREAYSELNKMIRDFIWSNIPEGK